MNSVKSLIAETPGMIGVSAKHLESGKTIQHNADTLFFTASTLKVPLLVELYRQVDEARIDLQQRVELTGTHLAPGGGLLKTLAPGLRPTVHDLATMMIIISDNTATDIICAMVGKENVNRTMHAIGLSSIKIPMNCKELLFDIVGLDPKNPLHTNKMVDERLSTDQIDRNATGFSEESSDVSSPNDMSTLLEMLYRGDLMSETSTKGVLDILKKQQLNNIIPLLLPPGTLSGHKTGTLHGVRCDVGLVLAPNGAYTVSIMAKQLPPGPERTCLSIDLKLAAISKAIYDTMVQ